MRKRDDDYDKNLDRLDEAYDDDYYDDYEDDESEDYIEEEEIPHGDESSVKGSSGYEGPVGGTGDYSDDRADYDDEYDREDYDDEYDREDYDDEYDREDYEDEYDREDYDDEYDHGSYRDRYEHREYYEDDYRKERNPKRRGAVLGKVIEFVKGTSVVERIAAGFALLLVVGGIITASFYVSAMNGNKQMDSFAEIGTNLAGVDLVGKSGLIAVADAEKARAMAASLVASTEEEEEEEVVVPDDAEDVTIQMTLTSIKSDMKVKFVNSKTNKLVADLPFEISVVTPDGTTVSYNDHDFDGIIYKKDITAGTYKITPKELPAEYAKYKLDTSTKSLTVKDQVELKTVDVSNEIKKESQVNVAAEDTAVKTQVESKLEDTVEWVESSKTGVGSDGGEYEYKSIDKATIVDPSASSSLVWGSYFKYALLSNIAEDSSSKEETLVEIEDGEDKKEDNEDDSDDAPTDSSTESSTDSSTESSTDSSTEETTDESVELISTDDPGEGDSDDSSNSGTTTEVIGTDDEDDKKKEPVPMSVSKITLVEGQSTKLSAQKEIDITLSSSDENIVEVSGRKITAKNEGSATITVSADKYKDAKVEVTVLSGKKILKDKDGNTVYVKDDDGNYREATYADYNTAKAFYIRKEPTSYKYTGWQTIDGKTYYFDKNGNYVTGEQVIQGAKYTFGSDGVLSSSSGVMGIDVSKWNGSIDWNQVKSSGVNFAIIRCGYRGSSQGALIEDPMFRQNIRGAMAAGIRVGVYFFTQAVNEVEAVEEASMVVKLISGYNLAFPVYLDVEASNGRGDQISASQRTANIKAFCGTIQNAGFRAGVYGNKTWLTSYINTPQLTSYKIWLAQYAQAVTYNATRYDMWQYTSKGHVSGISGYVDLNISY